MSQLVYIGAVGRSGTTLLERTVATSPHAVALGEMVHLWERGVRDREPCSCGEELRACPFWRKVGEAMPGGWDGVDLASLTRDRRMVDRNRYIPFLVVPRLAPQSFRDARERLLATLQHVYDAVDEIAAPDGGEVVVVDSSKHPSYLFLLRGLRGHSIRLLHVVRDPRGVAHSWAKQVERPESGDDMEQLGTARAIMRWTSHNLLFQLAGRLGVPRRRLSYERFTRSPEVLGRTVQDLLGEGALPVADTVAVTDSTVELGADHTVSGNPMRFRSGSITIRSDEGWRDGMSRVRRIVVGLLTTPLRQVYAR